MQGRMDVRLGLHSKLIIVQFIKALVKIQIIATRSSSVTQGLSDNPCPRITQEFKSSRSVTVHVGVSNKVCSKSNKEIAIDGYFEQMEGLGLPKESTFICLKSPGVTDQILFQILPVFTWKVPKDTRKLGFIGTFQIRPDKFWTFFWSG